MLWVNPLTATVPWQGNTRAIANLYKHTVKASTIACILVPYSYNRYVELCPRKPPLAKPDPRALQAAPSELGPGPGCEAQPEELTAGARERMVWNVAARLPKEAR